jgi:hypothetical protein
MLDSKKLKPAKRKKIKIELKVRILSFLDANGPTMNFFVEKFRYYVILKKDPMQTRSKKNLRMLMEKMATFPKRKL